jgi:hypothetical protein
MVNSSPWQVNRPGTLGNPARSSYCSPKEDRLAGQHDVAVALAEVGGDPVDAHAEGLGALHHPHRPQPTGGTLPRDSPHGVRPGTHPALYLTTSHATWGTTRGRPSGPFTYGSIQILSEGLFGPCHWSLQCPTTGHCFVHWTVRPVDPAW